MTHATTVSTIPSAPNLETAWKDVHSSFERFCLTAGIGALEQMPRKTPSGSPDRTIAAILSVPAGAGVRPRGRSVSTAARWTCAARGCAAPPPARFRCRAAKRRKPRTGLAVGR